jgi:hypothetical protein
VAVLGAMADDLRSYRSLVWRRAWRETRGVWNFHRWSAGLIGVLGSSGGALTIYFKWLVGAPITRTACWGVAGAAGTVALAFCASFLWERFRAPRFVYEELRARFEGVSAAYAAARRTLERDVSQVVPGGSPRRLSPPTQQALVSLLARGGPGTVGIYVPYLGPKDKREREAFASDFKTAFELAKWKVIVVSRAADARDDDGIIGIALVYYAANPQSDRADLEFLKRAVDAAGIPCEVAGVKSQAPYTGGVDTRTPVIYIGERE